MGREMMSSRVTVRWEKGAKPIMDFRIGEKVLTFHGLKRVKGVIRQDYEGPIYFMGRAEMVTPNQLFYQGSGIWQTAEKLFRNPVEFKGPVWTLEIDTTNDEERNYTLGNGRLARNGN